MKPSNAKKRRLAALNKYKATGVAQVELAATKPVQTQQQPVAVCAAAVAAAAAAAAACQPAASTREECGTFPYNPLPMEVLTSSTAAKLRMPAPATCSGSVDDILEQLMIPNMPPPTARNMISSRTVDKSVVLENPTAKLNITKPSSASKARQQRLAGKLLPRAKRNELCQLPTAGLDYSALTPLHELWGKYVTNVLSSKPDAERLLPGLDWHGAVVRVASHKNPVHAGRAGIVAKSTANTFLIVSPDGLSSIVPFKGAVFECVLPGINQTVELSSSSGLSKLQCKLVASSNS